MREGARAALGKEGEGTRPGARGGAAPRTAGIQRRGEAEEPQRRPVLVVLEAVHLEEGAIRDFRREQRDTGERPAPQGHERRIRSFRLQLWMSRPNVCCA